MPITPSYSVEQAMGQRQSALDQLAELRGRRSTETQRLYDEEQRALQDAEWEAGTDWHQAAGKGMSMGSVFGPIGMGVGAAIGGGIGALGAIQHRRKAGKGWVESVGRTLGDVDPRKTMRALTGQAPAAVANLERYRQQQKATQALERQSMDMAGRDTGGDLQLGGAGRTQELQMPRKRFQFSDQERLRLGG